MHRDDSVVFALVVVNHAAGQRDLATLAVDWIIRRGYMLIESGRVSDQLEDRSGLVDIADRVVAQERRSRVAEEVGIEGGSDGQRENLACMHVLHDHSSRSEEHTS